MKQLITSVCILFIAFSGIAQSDSSSLFINNSRKPAANRVDAVISMGAGVSVFNSRTPSTFTYIAPALQYQVSPKFTLQAGLIHYNVNGSSFITKAPGENNYPCSSKMYSGNIIQLGGLYQLNERVTFSGSVMYQVNPLTANKQVKISATSLGLDYKVNPHTTLSIKTNIIEGRNGYNSMYYSPFGPSTMPTNAMQRTFNNVPNTYFPGNF